MCQSNHKANHPNCPRRASYLLNRDLARKANNQPKKPPQYVPAPTPPPLTGSYADPLGSKYWPPIQRNKSATDINNNSKTSQRLITDLPSTAADEVLLSPEALYEIITKAWPILRAAKTKADQIISILTICAEHVSEN